MYLIDVPSICNEKRNSKGKPMLIIFDRVFNYLQKFGIELSEIIGFSDSSFKYHIDNKDQYLQYISKGIIIEMPAAIKADKAIIAYCLKHDNAVLISQDLYREYYRYLPNSDWISKRRICIVIVKDELYIIPMVEDLEEDPKKKFDKSESSDIEKLNNIKKRNKNERRERTTIEVLKDIRKSELTSEWDLFSS